MRSFLAEFLATDVLALATRPLLLPVLFGFCNYLYPVNRSRAVVLYGSVLSIARLAEIIGSEFAPVDSSRTRDVATLLLFLGSFILAFSTNISFVVVSIFIIFLSSSCMKKWFAAYESHWRHLSSETQITNQNWDRGPMGGATQNRYFDMVTDKSIFSSEGYTKRTLFVFAFVSLISCYLYIDDKDSSFPQFHLCFYYACFVALSTVLLYTASKLMIKKKKGAHANTMEGFGRDSSNSNGNQSKKARTRINPARFDEEVASRLAVPEEFVAMAKGDDAKAKTLYLNSLKWRHEFNVDSILETPQPSFRNVVELYPHAIHGKSKDGCIVLYEVLGKAKTRELQAAGVATDDLVWHFNLRNEFVFQHMRLPGDPPTNAAITNGDGSSNSNSNINNYSNSDRNGDNDRNLGFQRVMTVLDVKGVGLTDITADVVSFIVRSSETVDSYYPGRVARLVICNSPWWFQTAWAPVAQVLPASVTSKISIISGCAGLDEFIDPSQRPIEYSGSDPRALGQSPEHLRFMQLPDIWRANSNGDDDNDAEEVQSMDSDNYSSSSSSGGGGGGNYIDSKASSGKKDSAGVWSWMKSFGGGGGGKGNKKVATVAYMGESNRFKFDNKTRQWTMDSHADSSDGEEFSSRNNDFSEHQQQQQHRGSRSRGRDFSLKAFEPITNASDELEEHALLLAIQAAQIVNVNAKTKNRFNTISDKEIADLTLSTMAPPQHNSSSSSSSFSSSSSSYGYDDIEADYNAAPSSYKHTKIDGANPNILIATGSMYLISSVCQQLFLALIPAFLCIPIDVGGSGFSVVDIGILASSVSMLLLLTDYYWGTRVLSLLKLSPLRVIRVACLLIIASCFVLPLVLRKFQSFPTQLGSSYEYGNLVNPTGGQSMDAKMGSLGSSISSSPISSKSSSLSSTIAITSTATATIPLSETSIAYLPIASSPSWSVFNIPIPCIFLALLISCSHIARIVSGMLLEVSLSSVAIQNPKSIIKALHFTISVLTPFCGSIMYALLINNHFASPLNASVIFALPICAISLVYILTLMISIQFRGDFGYIPDFLDGNSSSPFPSSTTTTTANHNSNAMDRHGISRASGGDRGRGGGEAFDPTVLFDGLLRVPVDDVSFIMSSSNSALYSMKLQTMKVDLKEL